MTSVGMLETMTLVYMCSSHILTPTHTFTSPTVCEQLSLTRYEFPIYVQSSEHTHETSLTHASFALQ